MWKRRRGGVRWRTVSEDEELLPLARGHLAEQRQQVVRHALGVLAHDAAGVGAARVEVPQQAGVPLLEGLPRLAQVVALGLDVVGDDHLVDGLGAAVGVRWADGAALGDGDHVREARGVAVDGGGRGEDDVGDVVLGHGAQERHGAADVDAVVLEGDLAGLADGLTGYRGEQRGGTFGETGGSR